MRKNVKMGNGANWFDSEVEELLVDDWGDSASVMLLNDKKTLKRGD